MRNLRLAISFLTRVPCHIDGVTDVAKATPWFPIVGLLVGAVGGGVFAAGSEILPTGVAAALAMATTALITGAFHHDGLGDIADAFGGGWTVEQRMSILKDSRHGTYAVVTLILSGLVAWSALSSLPPAWGAAGMIAAHVLARSAILATLLVGRSAGSKGLGTDYASGLPRTSTIVGMLVGVAITFALIGVWAAAAMAFVAATTVAVVALSYRKIGGFSGDVLGAIEQLGECAVLVTISAAALRSVSPWWI